MTRLGRFVLQTLVWLVVAVILYGAALSVQLDR
jgi:hypothetical protein